MSVTGDEHFARALGKADDASARGALFRQFWKETISSVFSEGFDGDASVFLAREMDQGIQALATAIGIEKSSIIAIGGYGRGRLAPRSDVDLLILSKKADDHEHLLPLFHVLWDAQISLSPMTHSPESALTAAREDPVTRTSFLDARLVCGDEELFATFQSRFNSLRKQTISEFVEQKLNEQEERHSRQSQAFEIEPDIKEGRGGLRDLDTLHWIERYLAGVEASPGAFIEAQNLLTVRERRRLDKLAVFFWDVRVHLHDVSGRPDEWLYFGLQQKLAARLGFRPRADMSDVESFMRYYFVASKEVSRLTTSVLDTLQRRAGRAPAPHGPAYGVMAYENADELLSVEKNLALYADELNFRDHHSATENLDEVFALFRFAGRMGVPIHADALTTAMRSARQIAPSIETRQEVNDAFLTVLRESKDLEWILRQMSVTGILGRLLPAYGGVIGKIEYGLFRQFTLDEHILQSAGVFSEVYNDRDDGRFPLTKSAMKTLSDVTVPILALLLRESEHGLIDATSEELRARVLDNVSALVANEDEAEMVAFLVTHRRLLSDTAMSRNVNDLEVVRAVADQIPTVAHLKHLIIVTSCWRRTAGNRSWEEFSKLQVRSLVSSVEAYLTGGEAAFMQVIDQRRQESRSKTRKHLGDEYSATFADFIERTDSSFWILVSVDAAVELTKMIDATERNDHPTGVVVRPYKEKFLEVIVYADDRTRMFADCAGAIAANAGSIYAASATAMAPRVAGGPQKAILILHIQALPHVYSGLDTTEEACSSLAEKLQEAINNQPAEISMPAPYIGDRRDIFDVDPVINFDHDASSSALILEMEALDRTGLLYDLARAFASVNVSIQLAFVSTFGHRAVDTFYLQTTDGLKVDDPDVIDALRASVREVVAGSAVD